MHDLIVIGSGIAGLTAALAAARDGMSVLLVTKERLEESNTWYAQGGIAAALGDDDTADSHYEDTLLAGADLCNPQAVRALVEEGPTAIGQLAALGVPFDLHGGKLALTREAAHSQRRIVHAGGDATGAAVETTLSAAVRSAGIEVREQTTALELLVEAGVCVGAVLAYHGTAMPKVATSTVRGLAVVLATGGAGQLYQATTNPGVATGDGIALAYRAGATVANLEFFQFHPTALYMPAEATKVGVGLPPPAFLISEAVRGEGGLLRNRDGERFMAAHPQAELAPRDVVARTIAEEMLRRGEDCVYLDLSHLDGALVLRRFPTIARTCAALGIDITSAPIPVAPAAHYHMGGVVADLWGRTSVPGLYACGEVAMTGVHGANRLASNSLLEGAVWGARIARVARGWLDGTESWDAGCGEHFATTVLPGPSLGTRSINHNAAAVREQLTRLMWRHVGIVREGDGLRAALKQIGTWRCENTAAAELTTVPNLPSQHSPLENMLLVAALTTEAALLREESRGAHARSDFPQRRAEWRRYIALRRP